MFRAKLLAYVGSEHLPLPARVPPLWNVGCQSVGGGDKAITYLGRYLYRGVIREKDIISIEGEQVTYRYTENNGRTHTRTLSGVDFLWRLLKHTLPKGFRRARNYGFLHHNSKRMIRTLQYLLLRTGLLGPKAESARPAICCPVCGAEMRLVAAGMRGVTPFPDTEPAFATGFAVM